MTLCGGCGLAGTKENHWQPPEHKCPRWNTEYLALRDIASLVEAAFDDPDGNGDTIDVNHMVRAVARWREIYERTQQVDHENAFNAHTCTKCGRLDPCVTRTPMICQKCEPVIPPTQP